MARIKMELKGNTAYYSELVGLYRDEIEDFLAVAIQDTETEAVQAAPSNNGILRSSSYSEIEGLEGLVGFKALYAPFMEFGTGSLVDAPSEWEDYAKTFQGQNLGTWEDFRASILDWMRSKGIEEKYLYPIMMKIFRIGVNPQPFLYPSWKRNSQKFLDNLKKMLADGTK